MQARPGAFRVLIVDDDHLSLQILTTELESAGFEVFALSTPIGVSQIVLAHEIDVILLDLNMPAIRGDRLAQMLRSHGRLKTVPIVFVSACSHAELAASAAGLDNVTLVPKSRVRTDLASVIWQLANQRRTGSEELSLTLSPSLAPPPMRAPSASSTLTALRARLLDELPNTAIDATKLVKGAAQGDAQSHAELLAMLQRGKGDAGILELPAIEALFVSLEGLVRAAPPGAPLSTRAHRALLSGLNALVRASRATVVGQAFDTKPVLDLIAQAHATGDAASARPTT